MLREFAAWALPQPGVARALYWQTLIFSTGSGVAIAGNAVFFVRFLGLSPVHVGLAMTIAAGASALAALPIGRAIDSFGPRQVWLIAAAVECVVNVAFPFVSSMAVFVGLQVLLTGATSGGNSARMVYSYGILEGTDRVRTLALFRVAYNVGLTAGGLLAAALILPAARSVLPAIPWIAAVAFLINSMYVARLPRHSVVERRRPASGRSHALRNRWFVTFASANGVIGTHQTLLAVVLPVWIASGNGPGWSAPAVIALNTVLVIVLQARLSTAASNLRGALRLTRVSGWATAGGCVVLWVSGDASLPSLIVGLVIATSMLSLTEIWQAAGEWGWFPEFCRPEERGQYQAVTRLTAQLPNMAAPLGFTLLLTTFGAAGWILLALLFAFASIVAAGAGPRVPVGGLERQPEVV